MIGAAFNGTHPAVWLWAAVGAFLAGAGAACAQDAGGAQAGGGEQAWPAPVAGFVAPQPGEHPRLFFRKSELPALRQRAQTPEGKLILARLKKLLGGGEAGI